MTIKSSFFGATTLTGLNAEKFRRQFTYGRPNNRAIESLRRGREMVKEMQQNGFVVIRGRNGR